MRTAILTHLQVRERIDALADLERNGLMDEFEYGASALMLELIRAIALQRVDDPVACCLEALRLQCGDFGAQPDAKPS